jgi:hypothetical protein
MVPNQAPPTSATITEPLPPLTRSSTLPAYSGRPIATDRTLLAPEDAIYQGSPPRKQSAAVVKLEKDLRMTNGENGSTVRLAGRGRHKDRTRSGSRRRKGTWKKLLWVKQSCQFYLNVHWTLLTFKKTQIITPIKIPSSNTFNAIPDCNRTISGLWSPILQSLSNTFAPS